MQIRLDDQALAVADGLTLAQLLARLDRPANSVATALNGSFVSRDTRETTILAEGDHVLLFQVITGG